MAHGMDSKYVAAVNHQRDSNKLQEYFRPSEMFPCTCWEQRELDAESTQRTDPFDRGESVAGVSAFHSRPGPTGVVNGRP